MTLPAVGALRMPVTYIKLILREYLDREASQAGSSFQALRDEAFRQETVELLTRSGMYSNIDVIVSPCSGQYGQNRMNPIR